MRRRASLTIKSVEEDLSAWLEQQPATMALKAEALPLRRDLVALLSFIRDHKVVGTPATGNMPLKAVREVTARFVDPPPLETRIGDKTFQLRSEEHLWPLYFLHILADVGGLIKTAPARRWRLTAQGERFLDIDPILQVPFLLAVWWHRVNWLVVYPFAGMGEALPYFFPQATLARLWALPTGTYLPFDQFADDLIGDTGLTWTAPDSSVATMALRGSIKRMVIGVLADFGALKCRFRKERLGKGTISKLAAFKITPWGLTLLNAVAAVDSLKQSLPPGPGRRENTVTKQQTRKRAARPTGTDQKLYTLEVSIISGPLTESFVKKNRVVSRTIQIRGDQTLEELHEAIFAAFDREEEHMYEFQIGGKGPMDPKARRYGLALYDDPELEGSHAGDVEHTVIGSLGLKVDQASGYWFDFGDDWWHQINVAAIEEKAAKGKFPKVIKRVGASPPQYIDWDEEDE
jgi:hypothetical protein